MIDALSSREPAPPRIRSGAGFRLKTLFGSLVDLMHLDDVAVRIVEEDLVPAVHGPGAVVRIGHALFVEPLLEGGDVVGAEGDVAAFKKRLEDKGIPYSDFGTWAMNGWHQIFFYDPDGNIIEVHQVTE